MNKLINGLYQNYKCLLFKRLKNKKTNELN